MTTNIWLNSKRFQFSIPKNYIYSNTKLTPFLFKICSSSGDSNTDLSNVFLDLLGAGGTSFENRKKVAFFQIVNGKEVPLYCELDLWDHSNKLAIFWIKPIELSAEYVNIFYFYYDKSKIDNVFISEAQEKSMRLLMPLGSQGTYDLSSNTIFDIIYNDNKYMLWYIGKSSSLNQNTALLYCESLDLITFTNYHIAVDWSHTFDSVAHAQGTVLVIDNVYKMWYCGNQTFSPRFGFAIGYCTSQDGLLWSSVVQCTGLNIVGATYSSWLCSVIFVDSKYKIWYTGSDGNIDSIFYGESTDGVSWLNVRKIVSPSDTYLETTQLHLCRVTFADNKYVMWFNIDSTGSKGIFYSESVDGVKFTKFYKFLDFSLEGVYDTNGYTSLSILERDDKYIFVYSSKDILNSDRLLVAFSVSCYKPLTPSQYIWDDLYVSVNHFNPFFGYSNSACTAAKFSIMNNVSSSYIIPEGYILNFNTLSSCVSLGNSDRYNSDTLAQTILFANFDSTTNGLISSKGVYSRNTSMLYYQKSKTLLRDNFNDNFSGVDGDLPDIYLWTVLSGNPRIYNNTLKFTSAAVEVVQSTFFVSSGLDINMSFTIDDGPLTNNWQLGLKLSFIGYASDILLSIYRDSVDTLRIVSHLEHQGTYIGSSTFSTLFDSYTGSLRFVGDSTTNNLHGYYFKDTAWASLGTFSIPTNCYYAKVSIFKATGSVNTLTTFHVTSFNTDFNTTFKGGRSKNDDVLAMDYRQGTMTSTLELYNYTLPNSWSLYAYGVLSSYLDTNTTLYNDNNVNYSYLNPINTNNEDIVLGSMLNSGIDSIRGFISEALITKIVLNANTLEFIKRSLNDSLLVFSTKFVRGYTTLLNIPRSTTLLVYNEDNLDLLSITSSNISTGFYYTEIPTVSKCFIVGLGDPLHNHFILSNITIQSI
jgi:hypothetical protein